MPQRVKHDYAVQQRTSEKMNIKIERGSQRGGGGKK